MIESYLEIVSFSFDARHHFFQNMPCDFSDYILIVILFGSVIQDLDISEHVVFNATLHGHWFSILVFDTSIAAISCKTLELQL
jgi:hypothetical protein